MTSTKPSALPSPTAPRRWVHRLRKTVVGANLAMIGRGASVVLVILSIALFIMLQIGNHRRLEAEFALAASEYAGRIEQGIDQRMNTLRLLQSFFAASTAVDREGFHIFTEKPLRQHPGMLGFAWVPRVAQFERRAFEQAVQADGVPIFEILEWRGKEMPRPSPVRDEYFPLTYLEPAELRAMIGFDVGSEPLRRAAIEQSRDTDLPVATPVIDLFFALQRAPGIVLALPIYRNGLPHGTLEQRRENFIGVVLQRVELEYLADLRLMSGPSRKHIECQLIDETDLERIQFLLSTPGWRQEQQRTAWFDQIRWSGTLNVAGRRWRLTCLPSRGFFAAHTRWQAWVMLGIGLVFSTILSGLLYMLGTSRERAVQLASRMTDDLRRQQALLLTRDRALASATEAVIITDPTQRDNPIVYCNAAFERMTGYTAQEVYGRNPRFLHGADHLQEGVMVLRQALAARESCRVAIRNYRKDGTMYWSETSIAPVLDDAGQLQHWIGVQTDITKRKRLEYDRQQQTAALTASNEEYLRQQRVMHSLLEDLQNAKVNLERQQQSLAAANAQLQQANTDLRATQLQLIEVEKLESIGRLAAGVAHEVKNPLAILLMGVEYLTRQLQDAKADVSAILADMGQAVLRADVVIKGLLDFSAPSQLQPATGNLNALIDHALTLVKHELDKHHVVVTKDFAPQLPLVLVDANKVVQVFVNLLTNAIDAMPDNGRITVRTAVVPMSEELSAFSAIGAGKFERGEPMIVVQVNDSGSGIPEDKLTKVFDPFFTTKPTGKGTGLGLTVTRKIVELHGGAIDIRNRPEGGARVTLLFHAEKEDGHERQAQTAHSHRG